MNIVFLTNYFNHHQSELACELSHCCDSYYFIVTSSMEADRVALGWKMDQLPSYVIEYKNNNAFCQKIIDGADVIIYGSSPYKLIYKHLLKRKPVLIYSERLFRNERITFSDIKKSLIVILRFSFRKNVGVLCAGAFTALDYYKLFCGRRLYIKWGYFPKTIEYDIEKVLKEKKQKRIELLWVARLIDLKHPELAIEAASFLKQKGYSFHLNIIGNGYLEDNIRRQIQNNNLSDVVTMLGSMKPDQVRTYMEKANIFIFTSDYNEGWGAVLNEAMNSGCAVLASSAIGSVPFLIEDKVNGYIYQNDNITSYLNKVEELVRSPELCETLGTNAYYTIIKWWNAKKAATALTSIIASMVRGERVNTGIKGPGSRAEFISSKHWYSNEARDVKKTIPE